MELELSHAEAVDKAEGGAHNHNCQQSNIPGQNGQTGEQLVGSQLQTCGDTGSQADHTTGRNIGTGQDDAAADAQSDGQLCSGQGDDVDDRGNRQEAGLCNGDTHTSDGNDDEHSIVHQQVADGSVSILGRHSLQLIDLGRLLYFQLRHVYFLLMQT